MSELRDVGLVVRTSLEDDALVDAVNQHGQLLFVRHEHLHRFPADTHVCACRVTGKEYYDGDRL